MSTSRRNFLKKGSVLVLAAGAPLSFTKKAVADVLDANPTESFLRKNDFAACLNSEFVVHNGKRAVRTQLIDVCDLQKCSRSMSDDKEGFSLVFRGERNQTLSQNTYVIQHDRLGKFSFLLVPTRTADKERNYYVATVNRLFP